VEEEQDGCDRKGLLVGVAATPSAMLSSTAVPASAVDQSPPTGNNHRQRVAAVVIVVIPHSELHLRRAARRATWWRPLRKLICVLVQAAVKFAICFDRRPKHEAIFTVVMHGRRMSTRSQRHGAAGTTCGSARTKASLRT